MKLQFVKETADVVNHEVDQMRRQILEVEAFELAVTETHAILIKPRMLLTMIDGKILNILTDTPSMQTCAICHATPIQFNDTSNWTNWVFEAEEGSLQYGISPLHCWIRFLECCLSISYRLEFKKWQAKGEDNKKSKDDRQQMIKAKLDTEMGLLVDCVRSHGAGTSNNGNTASRAFTDYKKFAEILVELDEELIHKFLIILLALSCQRPIDPIKFTRFALSAAELYVSKYNWFYMPQSTHKVLMHGTQIIMSSTLPVGVLSEEAGESSHKLFKRGREFHSRKTSPEDTMRDMFTRRLGTSDPIISSFSLDARLKKKRRLPMPSEVLDMLALDEDSDSSTDSEGDSTEDEEEDSAGLLPVYDQLQHVTLDVEDID